MARWKLRRQSRSGQQALGDRTGAPDAHREFARLAQTVAEIAPSAEVDVEAVERVARSYARRGLDLERLLADVEHLSETLGPVGPGPSELLERSALAWSDAYLEAYAADSPLAVDSAAVRDRIAPLLAPSPWHAGGGTCVTVALTDTVEASPRVHDDVETVARIVVHFLPEAEVLMGNATKRAVLAVVPGTVPEPVMDNLRAAVAEHLSLRYEVTHHGLMDNVDVAAATVEQLAG